MHNNKHDKRNWSSHIPSKSGELIETGEGLELIDLIVVFYQCLDLHSPQWDIYTTIRIINKLKHVVR